MLKQAVITDFNEIYTIMEEAFPLDERRSYDGQKALLKRQDYKLHILKTDEGKIKAFAAVYDLGEVLFLEHFAVSPEHRNAGLGSKILGALFSRYGKRICLEVELPETDTAKRRIGFYERNGFSYNDYEYIQPSLGEGRGPIPLRLMTTGERLSEKEYKKIKALVYREVYGKKTD